MKGYIASLLTVFGAVILAVMVNGMPIELAAWSLLLGALNGLFPICWIIISAVFLYNITVRSGQFEVIKTFMASITPDRRLQALLIAFSFGAFLEGAAGFGSPVAISASLLVGLGFNPLYAAGLCLVANTAPVAFGAVGTPIIIASRVSDIPEMAISQMVGRTLPLLSMIVPFYLVTLMAGFKRTLEVLPAVLVSGMSFAFFQWLTSNYMGPLLPDVIAGIMSILCLMLLLKYWKPKSSWRFEEETVATLTTLPHYSLGQIFRAWSPFLIMTIMIICWGLLPVKMALNSIGIIKFELPALHDAIYLKDGDVLTVQPFEINYISSPGTAVLLASLISLPLIGLSFREAAATYWKTLKQLTFPMITIASVLGFAFVANYSGMSTTMAIALAGTGGLFSFFSPVLGWLGVFLTGSDTSSNALFCRLQYNSAEAIGIDPVITVSANASGGVTGKMISPQSVAIGAAAVGLIGKESDLFRFTFKHSFIMLLVICLITTLQAYWLPWIVPAYQIIEKADSPKIINLSQGFLYLGILGCVLTVVITAMLFVARKRLNHKS